MKRMPGFVAEASLYREILKLNLCQPQTTPLGKRLLQRQVESTGNVAQSLRLRGCEAGCSASYSSDLILCSILEQGRPCRRRALFNLIDCVFDCPV